VTDPKTPTPKIMTIDEINEAFEEMLSPKISPPMTIDEINEAFEEMLSPKISPDEEHCEEMKRKGADIHAKVDEILNEILALPTPEEQRDRARAALQDRDMDIPTRNALKVATFGMRFGTRLGTGKTSLAESLMGAGRQREAEEARRMMAKVRNLNLFGQDSTVVHADGATEDVTTEILIDEVPKVEDEPRTRATYLLYETDTSEAEMRALASARDFAHKHSSASTRMALFALMGLMPPLDPYDPFPRATGEAKARKAPKHAKKARKNQRKARRKQRGRK
jgi:hypothetical protein